MKDKKILIIDFDVKSLIYLSELLQDEGFEVIIAKDGQEGLAEFESKNPDLVIMEPMLPKIHGFDLCNKISNESSNKIPVIFITGFYREDHYKTDAIRTFGASAYFKKPYKEEELISKICDLLDVSREEEVKEEKAMEDKATEEKVIEEVHEELKTEVHETIQISESVPEERIESPETEFIPKKVKKMERDKDVLKQFDDEFSSLRKDLSKTGKKAKARKKIDDMLKDTISDFGLGRKKEKPQVLDSQREVESEIKSDHENEIKKERERGKEEENQNTKHFFFKGYLKKKKKQSNFENINRISKAR